MKTITKNREYNIAWLSENIKQHSIGDALSHLQTLNGETIFYFKREIENSELDDFLENHNPDTIEPDEVRAYDLKIAPLLQEELIGAPYNVVDFKRHLKPLKTLNKTVEMNVDGRPLKAIYSYNDVIMAELCFVFRGTPLMSRRTEVLYYKLLNGNETLPIVIKDKIYNMNNSQERTQVMDERELARQAIISDVKGSILGIIQLTSGLNEEAISQLVVPFFNEYESLENEFIKLGTPSYMTALSEIDLETTPYSWLGYQVSNDINVRDFLISKLIYTTEETHLDFDYSILTT